MLEVRWITTVQTDYPGKADRKMRDLLRLLRDQAENVRPSASLVDREGSEVGARQDSRKRGPPTSATLAARSH